MRFGREGLRRIGGIAIACATAALTGVMQTGSSTAAARFLRSEARIGDKFTFDLANGSVRGYAVIGKTYPSVVKALGKPDHRSIRREYGTASYGELQKGAWPLTISFVRRDAALRAWSVAIASPLASEVRLGRILRASPKLIQSRIVDGYSAELRLAASYRCRTRPLRCRGEFESTTDELKVGFGLVVPRQGSARYIVTYQT
jgi:hypothetical protein